MYNEIEELEKRLTRKPAAMDMEPINIEGDLPQKPLSFNEQKKIMTLPDSTKFADPTTPRNLPGIGKAPESIVGGRAPDYSGYDDLEKRLQALRPRDTSTADLINMGISTGIGALFGRTGVGAKEAGAYGMDRFNKAETRANSLEDMILKLRAARAAQMAKGSKGQKVKGAGADGLDAKTLYKMSYIGNDGLKRNYRFVDDKGQPVPDMNDPVADLPTIQLRDQKNADGSVNQVAMTANQVKEVGQQNANVQMVRNAKGEMVPVNTRTVGQQGLPEDFNKNQVGLSPVAGKKYDEVSRRKQSDPNLARYQQAASDLRAAAASLGSDGELSPGFLLATQRFLGMGMDKGRSLTNDEFAKVEGVNTGMVDRFKNTLLGYKEGKVGSDQVRQEYRKLTALLSNNVEQLRNERINDYNKELKQGLGKEYRDELSFGGVGGVTAKQQAHDVNKSEKLSDQLRSDKAIVVPHPTFKNPDGSPRRVKMGFNPATKKYDRYLGDE